MGLGTAPPVLDRGTGIGIGTGWGVAWADIGRGTVGVVPPAGNPVLGKTGMG
jgi:hypothetical protein